jgi:thioredoxin-like negative regulator of GroEL
MNFRPAHRERKGIVDRLNKHESPARLNIIYYRPATAACTPLDEKLFDVAARYRGQVRLVVRHSDESGHLFGCWVSGQAPTVLLVRESDSVAQMIGDLPRHEIEQLVLSSLGSTQPQNGKPLPRPERRAS